MLSSMGSGRRGSAMFAAATATLHAEAMPMTTRSTKSTIAMAHTTYDA